MTRRSGRDSLQRGHRVPDVRAPWGEPCRRAQRTGRAGQGPAGRSQGSQAPWAPRPSPLLLPGFAASGCPRLPTSLAAGLEGMAAAQGDRSTSCDSDMAPSATPCYSYQITTFPPKSGHSGFLTQAHGKQAGRGLGHTGCPEGLVSQRCLCPPPYTTTPSPRSCFAAGGAAINCVGAHQGALSCRRH